MAYCNSNAYVVGGAEQGGTLGSVKEVDAAIIRLASDAAPGMQLQASADLPRFIPAALIGPRASTKKSPDPAQVAFEALEHLMNCPAWKTLP